MQNNYYWSSHSGPYQPHYYQNAMYYQSPDAPLPYPPPSSEINQYQELRVKCKKLQQQNQQLKRELDSYKDPETQKEKKKVQRRTEEELDKRFNCPYANCKKQYASSLAMNLHMKKKHNGGTKKQRDQFAKLFLKAKKEGNQLPKSTINLPPNYLQVHILESQTYQEEKAKRSIRFKHEDIFIDDDLEEESEDLSFWEKQIDEQIS